MVALKSSLRRNQIGGMLIMWKFAQKPNKWKVQENASFNHEGCALSKQKASGGRCLSSKCPPQMKNPDRENNAEWSCDFILRLGQPQCR